MQVRCSCPDCSFSHFITACSCLYGIDGRLDTHTVEWQFRWSYRRYSIMRLTANGMSCYVRASTKSFLWLSSSFKCTTPLDEDLLGIRRITEVDVTVWGKRMFFMVIYFHFCDAIRCDAMRWPCACLELHLSVNADHRRDRGAERSYSASIRVHRTQSEVPIARRLTWLDLLIHVFRHPLGWRNQPGYKTGDRHLFWFALFESPSMHPHHWSYFVGLIRKCVHVGSVLFH